MLMCPTFDITLLFELFWAQFCWQQSRSRATSRWLCWCRFPLFRVSPRTHSQIAWWMRASVHGSVHWRHTCSIEHYALFVNQSFIFVGVLYSCCKLKRAGNCMKRVANSVWHDIDKSEIDVCSSCIGAGQLIRCYTQAEHTSARIALAQIPALVGGAKLQMLWNGFQYIISLTTPHAFLTFAGQQQLCTVICFLCRQLLPKPFCLRFLQVFGLLNVVNFSPICLDLSSAHFRYSIGACLVFRCLVKFLMRITQV